MEYDHFRRNLIIRSPNLFLISKAVETPMDVMFGIKDIEVALERMMRNLYYQFGQQLVIIEKSHHDGGERAPKCVWPHWSSTDQ